MTAAARPARHAAICARVDHHVLIAAECLGLTGGDPDDDGFAVCRNVDLVGRAAYVKQGLSVIASASSFSELVAEVAEVDFPAEAFRIDVHDPSGRIDRSSQDVVTALADVIPYGPNLRQPRHRFVVAAGSEYVSFGEVVAEADASYRRHDSKPWTTSSSLDGRFARALINLVPTAGSVLDPCCGAGSIVLEAASLGLDAFGVDWKPAMVGMTRANVAHFGYTAAVVRADSRVHDQVADAIVTDLPYGHAIEADELAIRAVLERGVELAPEAVYVAPADITGWLSAAGYTEIELCTVRKRAGFTRWVHRVRRATERAARPNA